MRSDQILEALHDIELLTEKDIKDIQEHPELMALVARGMGAVNLANLYKIMQVPDVPIENKIEFQKLLNKMAGFGEEKRSVAPDGGFKVIINIPQVGNNAGAVIEAVAPSSLPAPVEEVDG